MYRRGSVIDFECICMTNGHLLKPFGLRLPIAEVKECDPWITEIELHPRPFVVSI